LLHVLVIVMLAAIATHDAIAKSGGVFARYYEGVAGWWTVLVVALPMLVLVGVTWLVCGAAGKLLDAGRGGALGAAERTGTAARIGAVLLHVVNVLLFGWLDLVRLVMGDVILLDELVSLSPALLVFCATWAAQWPLEKRVRDAVTMRGLDSGATVYPMPTRKQFVISHLRHQVLLSLVPIGMLLGWAECAEWAADWLSRRQGAASGVLAWLGGMARDPSTRSSGLLAVQLVGVAIVLSIAPLALRFVWDTVKLSPGPLRERLVGMCKQHDVGVRELRVWRTHGAMINGAVMGLWGKLRYILLTDALLDSLPRQQVEAVMAHELGHVRHKHVPWLAAVMITSLMGLSLLGTLLLWGWAWVALPREVGPDGTVGASTVEAAAYVLGAMGLEVVVGIGLLVGTVLIFLFVSRRFEWQADAFAAMHLSTPGAMGPAVVVEAREVEAPGERAEAPPQSIITVQAVGAMAGALEAVSFLNNIPLNRGGLRHGSLALRIGKLRRLAGARADALPIDRTVRRIKIATAVVGLVIGGLMGAALWFGL